MEIKMKEMNLKYLFYCIAAIFLTTSLNAQTVTITSDAISNTICAGTNVTFTADQTGVSIPNYQWYKNGIAISGATSITYTTNSLVQNDVISVKIADAAPVAPSNIVNSNLALYLDALDNSSYSGSGDTWHDLSGNGNDVSMQNAGDITWNAGGYFSLGGSGFFANNVANNLPQGNSPYNLSVWVKLSSDWGNQGLISIGEFGNGNLSNAFRTNGTNAFSHYWWGNDLTPSNGILSPTNSWFNAVAQFDGTTRTVWINGVLLGSDLPGDGHNVNNSMLQIGKTCCNEYLNGDIGQALIYNQQLSADEIVQNFNAEKTRFGIITQISSNEIALAINNINTITLSSAFGTDAQTLCNNTPIANITYTTTGATGATFSGLPAGVSGVWLGDIVTLAGTPTVEGNFAYTISLTGGCGSISISGAIIIDALPVVSISPGNTTIHVGDAISLTAAGASNYLWGYNSKTPLDQVSDYKLAVGLRLLSAAYTGAALRLRRSSDNSESDFGFIGNNLDLNAISSFLGASDGYCTILYDQSGSGNDVVQTDASRQPLFVAAGQNNKPVLRFSTSQLMINNTDFSPPYSVVFAAKQTGPTRERVFGGLNNNWLLGWWGGTMTEAHFDGWVDHASMPADNNPYVFSASGNGTISSFYQNGVLMASNSGGLSGPNGIELNGSGNGGETSDADIYEAYVFNAVIADPQREKIEKSIGSYFGFYGLPNIPGATNLVSPVNTTQYSVNGYSANNGCVVSADVTITVLQNPSLSNFSDKTKTFFDQSYTIGAPMTSSPGIITYTSSNPAVATIVGTTVNIIGAGVTTITASQEASPGYFSASITAQLTVNLVTVLSLNGEVNNSKFNYINKNGAIGSSNTVTVNGESKSTKSNDGLSAQSPGISAYQIKQDYPAATDGIYWITNSNINGGAAFQIYADMTTDGGGWTLIMKNSNNGGWDYNNAISLNTNLPFSNAADVLDQGTANYSILSYADYIKKSASGFQYMIDATTRRSFGGIWTANDAYSFVKTDNSQTNITLDTKFGNWNYVNDNGISERMPWYQNDCGVLTTDNGGGNWWGTLISTCGWSPAPWIDDAGGGDADPAPGIIWYWVR